ncbi:MAG: RNA-binding S4 domain-containing protein [Acidobacteria bacterium]|nr:RNA-binding S4 domain-containing protein [Acidobacteriota bacterium]
MSEADRVRLDVWLDVACLFKTRSQAQVACKGGKVEVNGAKGKPQRQVSPGDEIRITLPGGWKKIVVVRGLATTHIPKRQARELYEDLTPPPTMEELELRRLQKMSLPPRRARGMGAPKKKERRQLRRIKEGW